MSSCLFCDQMFPLSPPTFFSVLPRISLGIPRPRPLIHWPPHPRPRHRLPGPHKVNKPSATEEIKRGRGQLGLGKAHKDKADSPAGP